jgi:flagellar biosynthesis protein FliQ
MDSALPTALFREGATVLATVSAPIMLGLLIAGLVIGVLQAATQINDPAVGTVPRLVIAVGIVAALGGWMIEHLAVFLASAITRLAQH